MPEIIQPLKQPLPKVQFIQRSVPPLIEHPQPRLFAFRLLQQAHIDFYLLCGKDDVLQGRDQAQPFQIILIILPFPHNLFGRFAQPPILIFF